MQFAEFFPGQIIEAGPVSVTEQEVIEFAKAYDPQWFHTDPEASAKGNFSGLIASGWQTCGLAMRLAVGAALQGSESFASPGLAYVKWPRPVRPGDLLWFKAEVLEVKRSSSKPEIGVLRWRWQLHNQHAAMVLDLEATSLFHLKPAATA